MSIQGRVCAWIVACGLIVPPALCAQQLSSHEVIELIVRDGPQARAIRAEAEVVRREQLARLASPNPIVSYSREGAGFTEFLYVEQSVRPFGLRARLSRAGVAATAAAEAERDARLWQLRSDAQTLIARLLVEEEKLSTLQTITREMERIIERLRIREQEGEGSRFDRLRAEQELADARQIATDAAASVAEARAAISAAVGDGTRVSRVAGILYTDHVVPPLEALVTRASTSRAELRALQSAVERFQIEAAAARRARLPAPTVIGGFKRADGEEGRASGGLFGVNVIVPLLDRGQRDAARWNAERERVEAERSFVTESIRAQVAAAAEVLALRREAVGAADSAAAGDDLARIAEVAYREGEASILELLDAHRTVTRARIRAIDMRLAARLAQIALEREAGDTLWP